MNPFSKRDSHSRDAVVTYKVLTLVSWLVAVIPSIYYVFEAPNDGVNAHFTIWDQNRLHHSGFTLNSVIVSIYW